MKLFWWFLVLINVLAVVLNLFVGNWGYVLLNSSMLALLSVLKPSEVC